MSLISVPNTFSPNTSALSSEVNANFTTIYDEFNGNISQANLAANAVTTAKVNDSAITTAKLNDGAVTAPKIDFGGSGEGIWWEEIGRTTLASAGDTISVTGLTAKKYLKIIAFTQPTGGSTTCVLRFNNDSGSNYALRRVTDGNQSTDTSLTELGVTGADEATNAFFVSEILNLSSQEKLAISTGGRSASGAANAPSIIRNSIGKWANTAAQITRVDVLNHVGSGDFAAGSQVIVLGHD